MESMIITRQLLEEYRGYLLREEKSPATMEKYLRDVERFASFAGAAPVTKELTVAYKQRIMAKGYAVPTINAMLAGLNSLMSYLGLENCRVRSVRQQRQSYCSSDKQLTRQEYIRLLDAARNRPRLRLLLQTICGTGIRVSELQYITVEAVKRGEAVIRCKNKTRTILIPQKLSKRLLEYARREKLTTGSIFVTSGGRPLNRSNIWAQMKQLCGTAGVAPGKVFPHNLRKLFAYTFYNVEKDIAKLADILGHSSINTTRIYIMSTGEEHRRKIDSLHLIL